MPHAALTRSVSGTSLRALALAETVQDESGIAEFVDPNKWLTYFPPLGKSDLQVPAGLPACLRVRSARLSMVRITHGCD